MTAVFAPLIAAALDKAPEVISGVIVMSGIAVCGWLYGRRKEKRVEQKAAIADALTGWTPSEYLNDLIKRGSTLSFGAPASWAPAQSGSEGIVTLEQLLTPLRVADSQTRSGKSGSHENMAEEDRGVALGDVFESTRQALLVLGDPGSGKSTSLASLAIDAARRWSKDGETLTPIWVNLATLVPTAGADAEALLLSGVPEIGLATVRGGAEGAGKLTAFLRRRIADGRALFLLDGLDEVKEHLLPEVRRAIGHTVGLRRGRVVVACRKFDYRQPTPNRRVPIDRELELLPYSPEEQRQYVRQWYDASVLIGRFSRIEAHDLGSALVNELREPELAQLAASPLLLALLTMIHSEEAKLPETMAVLCDRAISYMLAESAKWRGREAGAATIATLPVLSLAVELAYRCHADEELEDHDGRPSLTLATINEAATQICSSMAQAERMSTSVTPEALAGRLLKSHGLLRETGGGRYNFAHRSFQEFLAGQHYAGGAHHEDAVKRGASLHWREPFRLMASLAGHEGHNLFYILALIRDLLRSKGPGAVASKQLSAEMLSEIGRLRLSLRKFHDVLEEGGEQGGSVGLWARARAEIVAQVDGGKLSLAERERSATVLGLLGDPRFTTPAGPRPVWSHMLDIEGGSAMMGSSRLSAEQLATTGGFLGGVRALEVRPFQISRYLVTNTQFREFVEGDGYFDPVYWVGAHAKGWMSGDLKILQMIREHWLATVHEHHAKEIRDNEIDLERLEEEANNRIAPRQHPYYWHDRRFNQPNQPVVGINWWEAAAFCEWATRRGHASGSLGPDRVIVLPTEFEWERASRPISDDRLYPWGDDWRETAAHVSTNTLNMRAPAPVGIYPEPWPGAPYDMAGNVWEWTASLYKPYGAEHDPERLMVDSLDERVVRGSSWYNSAIVSACSARAVDRSYNLFYDVGFRVGSVAKVDMQARI